MSSLKHDESILNEADKKAIKSLEELVKKGVYTKEDGEKKIGAIYEKRLKSNKENYRRGTVFVLNLDGLVNQVKNNDPKVKEISLEDKKVTNSVVTLLMEALKNNTNVKKVDLKKNLFEDSCISSICEMLLKNTSVET